MRGRRKCGRKTPDYKQSRTSLHPFHILSIWTWKCCRDILSSPSTPVRRVSPNCPPSCCRCLSEACGTGRSECRQISKSSYYKCKKKISHVYCIWVVSNAVFLLTCFFCNETFGFSMQYLFLILKGPFSTGPSSNMFTTSTSLALAT